MTLQRVLCNLLAERQGSKQSGFETALKVFPVSSFTAPLLGLQLFPSFFRLLVFLQNSQMHYSLNPRFLCPVISSEF